MGGGYDNEHKPSSSFVHLSYKSLIDFENLQRTEDTYFDSVLKLFSNYMVAATLGAYIAAKSSLFQDRFGALVITGVLTVILANTPIMNKTQRQLEGYGVYFFSGTCLSTILWWNLGMDHWVVVRWFMGIALSGYFYTIPFKILCLIKRFTTAASDDGGSKTKIKRANDTNRLIFYGAGPLTNIAGLMLAETLITYVTGITYFLTPEMRLKIVLGCSIWNFIHGQFNIVKCRLYDRDVIWQMVLLVPETVLSLFFVPKSLFIQQEDDY